MYKETIHNDEIRDLPLLEFEGKIHLIEDLESLKIVHYNYFRKMISNLNILQDIQPDFELVQDIYENKRFFGFFMPFQNCALDENNKPMYDGPAHGPTCALHTNTVYETMKEDSQNHVSAKIIGAHSKNQTMPSSLSISSSLPRNKLLVATTFTRRTAR